MPKTVQRNSTEPVAMLPMRTMKGCRIMIKVNGYGYDAMNNVLTASAAFLKKASQLNTPEYAIVKQLRADNPGMAIVKAEKRSNENRPVNITFKKMEEFIGLCADGVERKKEFAKVKALSKIQSSPYKYVKTWFMENYANYSEQPEFDKNGYIVVKTRAEMEAEQLAQKEESAAEAKVEAVTEQEKMAAGM